MLLSYLSFKVSLKLFTSDKFDDNQHKDHSDYHPFSCFYLSHQNQSPKISLARLVLAEKLPKLVPKTTFPAKIGLAGPIKAA